MSQGECCLGWIYNLLMWVFVFVCLTYVVNKQTSRVFIKINVWALLLDLLFWQSWHSYLLLTVKTNTFLGLNSPSICFPIPIQRLVEGHEFTPNIPFVLRSIHALISICAWAIIIERTWFLLMSDYSYIKNAKVVILVPVVSSPAKPTISLPCGKYWWNHSSVNLIERMCLQHEWQLLISLFWVVNSCVLSLV